MRSFHFKITALIVAQGFFSLEGRAAGNLFSLDTEQPSGNPMKLVNFPPNPGDGLNVTEIASTPGLPSDPSSASMDFGTNGSLFVAPLGNTLYKIDSSNGNTLGSISISGDGDDHIAGVAVHTDGTIYLSQDLNPGAKLWSVDFDAQQTSLVMTTATKIDDIDFDDLGNLVGEDLNDTGNLYDIPLDGSQPSLLASLGIQPVTNMTFSPEDDAFFLKRGGQGQTLYTIPWSSGLPSGPFAQIDTIGPGQYVGLAAIPEPVTVILFSTACLISFRRRYRIQE